MRKPQQECQHLNYDTPNMILKCLSCNKISCDYGTCAEIEKEIRRRNRSARKDTKLYYMDGETHPLSFWASMYNLTPGALRHRLQKCGNDLEMALKGLQYQPPCIKYTAFGHTFSIAEWATLCDVTPSTIRYRIKSGKPLEVVFFDARMRLKEGGRNV